MGLRRIRLCHGIYDKKEHPVKHYPIAYVNRTGAIPIPIVFFGLEKYSLTWGCSYILLRIASDRISIFRELDNMEKEDEN